MHARVPQDVDLEDKLVYGLSPLRFGYLVVAALCVVTLWRLEAMPAALRLLPCLVLGTAAVLLAWGRWHGRSVDGWLVDVAIFARRNYRLGLSWRADRRGPQALVPLEAINSLGERLQRASPDSLDPPRVT